MNTRQPTLAAGASRPREGVDHVNMDLVNQVTDAYLKTAEGTDAARLRFLKGIWEIQSAIEATDRSYDAPEATAANEALATGRPLFTESAPAVPIAEYVDAVSRIALYTSETAGLPAEQAEALRHADFATAIVEEALTGAVCAPEAFVANVASELGAQPGGPLTPATVAFVLTSALVPFLTGPARIALAALGDRKVSSGAGTCPVCGSAASMGLMGESTQLKGAERTLWCGLCQAEWSYERLRCVRCGSRNPDKLRYTHVETDSAHRLHLCDECHGYTRFVFTDDLGGPVSMVVEDAVTATLEAIASEQGYTATGDGGAKGC
jgi:FdhE protein